MKRLYTHSASQSFRSCNYSYFVAYVLGVRARHAARALLFGTLIHKCLEAYWLARKAGNADPLGVALTKIPEDMEDMFERARARVMLIAYASVWGLVGCEVIAVEEQFEVDLFHPVTKEVSDRFRRAGKLDLILRLKSDGKLVVVEHKTSSRDVGPGGDYRRRLTLDEQISFYYAGAISLGFAPDRFIYDVLKKFDEKPLKATPLEKRVYVVDRKTKLRRLKTGQRLEDETPDAYEVRLGSAVAKAPFDHVERVEVQRLVSERKKFALEVWKQSKLMVYALDNDLFPQNSDACFRYGSPCQYAEHCYEGALLTDPTRYRKLEKLHPELEEDAAASVV